MNYNNYYTGKAAREAVTHFASLVTKTSLVSFEGSTLSALELLLL